MVVYAAWVLDRDLAKIEVSWKYLTASQWSGYSSARFSPEQTTSMCGLNTSICKQGSSSAGSSTPVIGLPLFRLNQTTKEVMSWLDCTVNFIDTGAEEITY